jgi:hypothetical protein
MSFYRWCMRYGAAILFVVALLQLAIGLAGPIRQLFATTSQMASSLSYAPSDMQWEIQLQMLLGAFSGAIFTFFTALAINRADRWLDQRDKAEPFE